MPENTVVTELAATFVENVTYGDIPEEAIRIGTRCILDAMGLYVAGSEESTVRILVEEALDMRGREDALLLGTDTRVPAPMAARVLGTGRSCS